MTEILPKSEKRKYILQLENINSDFSEDSVPALINLLASLPLPFKFAKNRKGIQNILERIDVVDFFSFADLKDELDKLEVNLEAINQVIDICEKLYEKCSKLNKTPTVLRTLSLLEQVWYSYLGFLNEGIFKGAYIDAGVMGATLDKYDVRSLARSQNLESDFSYEIHLSKISTKLAEKYRENNILNVLTIEYLVAGVSVQDLETFLSFFSNEEQISFYNLLSSESYARSLKLNERDPGYMLFLVEMVKRNIPLTTFIFATDSGKKKSISLEVYKHFLRYPSQKQNFITLITEFKISPVQAFDCIKSNKYKLEDMISKFKLYNQRLSNEDILQLMMNNVPLEEVDVLAQYFPKKLCTAEVFTICLKDKSVKKKLSKSILMDIKKFFKDSDNVTLDTLLWYLSEVKHNKKMIKFFRDNGIDSVVASYDISKWMAHEIVPSAYVLWILKRFVGESINIEEAIKAIQEWYENGITLAQIEAASSSWNIKGGISWYLVSSKEILQYLQILKNSSQKIIMESICNKYDLYPVEIVNYVASGATLKDFDFVDENNLPTNFVLMLKTWPNFREEWGVLSEERKSCISKLRSRNLLEAKKANPDTTLKQLADRESASVKVEEIPDTDFLDYKEKLLTPTEDDRLLVILSIFKIPPKYMQERLLLSSGKLALNANSVNHVILCAYLNNILDDKFVKLIEKYNIQDFASISHEVLLGMANDYVDMPNRKTAIVLKSKTDYNSSSDDLYDTLSEVSNNYNVYVFEMGNKKNFEAIRKLGEEQKNKGKKLDLVLISSHGSENLLQLGYPYSNYTTHLSTANASFLSSYRKFLADDAQCVLAVCSTAKRTLDNGAFAYKLAEAWKGIEVFASNSSTSFTGLIVDDGRVTDVKFSNESHNERIKYTG